MKRRVLIVCPTSWDERQFAALPPEVRADYELVFDQPRDEDVRWDLDVGAFVAERVRRWRGALQGVFSSSDYPGAIAAAAIASELGLPGAPPASVLTAAHKYYSRLAQQAVVPEAVPRFALFDPSDERSWPPARHFPCFVKPVKGSFSSFARRIADHSALRVFAAAPALAEYRDYYVRPFDEFAARHARFEHGARAFLAEELLSGAQVTVEGWVQGGRAHVLGVVDTSFHPGTPSFARFDYPSALPPEVQARLGHVACATALALGLDHTLFNVELFHDVATGRSGLIEINPRPCGQFADLYQKVDGTSGFELALALATGRELVPARGAGAFAAAASVPLRVFRSVRVRRAPDPAAQRALEARHADTLVWSECRAGEEFRVQPEVEDGHSVRYGVVNLGAAGRGAVADELAVIERELGFEFEPLEPGVGVGLP